MTLATSEPATETTPAPSRLSRGEKAVLALPVLFNLWFLRIETQVVEKLNDGSVHAALIRAAGRSYASWHIPLDPWFGILSTGSAAFHEYQASAHIFTGFFARFVGGDRAYQWSLYLLLAVWPIAVYAGARLLGWRTRPALAAALVSPLAANAVGYGYEFGSYLFAGLGVWSQAWGMVLLPLALGVTWRAVTERKSLALAALVLSLLIVAHVLTGYFAVLAIGVWVLVGGAGRFAGRVGRAAAVTVGAAAIASWLIVPLWLDRKWVALISFVDTLRGGHGLGRVLSWLFTGKLFDAPAQGGRFPIITVLVFAGIVSCIVTFRRDVRSRALLGLWVLAIVLYAGRPTFGFLLDRLPGSETLIYRRYILAVHMVGILLAGVGASRLVSLVMAVGRGMLPAVKPAVASFAVLVLGLVVLAPAWRERAAYAGFNTRLVHTQENAEILDGGARIGLIEAAKTLGGGRVYAGFPNNWGKTYRIGYVQGYASLLNHDADQIGFTFRLPGVLSETEAYMNERDPYQLDLFGIRYLLLPRGKAPPVRAQAVQAAGDHVLWQTPSSGYVRLADTIEPVRVDGRTQTASAFVPFMRSANLRKGLFPTVAYLGQQAARPTASALNPPKGSPGAVVPISYDPANGVFRAEVRANRTTAVVLKASDHGRWQVTVDGRKAPKYMVAPGYPAVTVSQGVHRVDFAYRSISFGAYVLFFLIALSALVLLHFGPRTALRRLLAGRPMATPDRVPARDPTARADRAEYPPAVPSGTEIARPTEPERSPDVRTTPAIPEPDKLDVHVDLEAVDRPAADPHQSAQPESRGHEARPPEPRPEEPTDSLGPDRDQEARPSEARPEETTGPTELPADRPDPQGQSGPPRPPE